MNLDRTQQQTVGDERLSEQLSLQMSAAPTIPGYRILRPVGAGAFGQVWLATDLNTGRLVAIKCYLNSNKLNLEALRREVGLLVNMSTGRHIVQVLKVGWDFNPPFFVMEYLENGSLDELIRRGELPSVQRSIEVITEIARGLEFAHTKGVIHCDLKPANVLLDHALQPRIADFGQGRLAGDETHSLGTLFFMAPEQAEEKSVPDVKWDVYSLGAIAYSLLAGSPPHRTQDITDSLRSAETLADRLQRYREALKSSANPRLHYRRSGVDRQLAMIVDRCLHVDPNKRYQNIHQVIYALNQRDRFRSHRPLYVLGIAGPILLTLLMLLFSAYGRQVALEQSEASVVQRAIESNRFAARYAARTLETDLQSLISLVESEAANEGLKDHVQAICSDGQATLAEISDGKATPQHVTAIRELKSQRDLEQYLQARVDRLLANHKTTQRMLTSIFVDDVHGTNLGIAFLSEAERGLAKSPVGQNFAYRSYFNGLSVDGLPSDPPNKFKPIRSTKLSSSFRSTSTGVWKIAISTPIWPDAEDANSDSKEHQSPLGILVVTINLGSFNLLQESTQTEPTPTRFAALFDGRQGNQQGTILQHPYLGSISVERMKSMLMPQLAVPVIESLVEGGLSNYEDPVADFEDGSAYGGSWIACVAQVELPQLGGDGQSSKTKSDLWILVQEQRQSVSAPIQSLARRLQRDILLQFIVLVGVIAALWYFVLRIRRDRASSTGSALEHSDSLAATVVSGRKTTGS